MDEDQRTNSDITVRQAIERWLEIVVLEDTTRELYVLPTFGDLSAGRLDAELIDRHYARLHRFRS